MPCYVCGSLGSLGRPAGRAVAVACFVRTREILMGSLGETEIQMVRRQILAEEEMVAR